MAGPWERFQKAPEAAPAGEPAGPWTKFQAAPAATEAPKSEPDWVERGSRAAIKGFVEAGRFVDSVTGAPTRAAIGAGMKGENPFRAFGRQFGSSPELAPTGGELARDMGFSDQKVIPTPFKAPGGKTIDLSPSQVAGTGIDVLADWTIVAPPTKILGGALKAGTKAAGVAGREGARALGFATKAIVGPEMAAKARNKIASAFANIPEEKIVQYMSRPAERVHAARPLEEVGRQIHTDVSKLRTAVQEGSKQAFDILDQAPGKLGPEAISEVRQVAQNQLAGLGVGAAPDGVGSAAKAGQKEILGVIDDLERAAGSTQGVGPTPSGLAVQSGGELSYRDAKRILQQLDAVTDYQPGAARFDSGSERALKTIRASIDDKLKAAVPEYAKAMEQVAADTRLLQAAGESFGDLNTVTGRLKTAATEHRSKLADQEVLDALGRRMGTDYVMEAEDRILADLFGKDSDRGSRYMNWGMGVGGTVGASVAGAPGAAVGSAIGGLGGLSLGKNAGAITRRVLDSTQNVRLPGKPTTEAIGEALKDIRKYTPAEQAGKASQVYSTQDLIGNAEERRTAIRRRLEKGKVAE